MNRDDLRELVEDAAKYADRVLVKDREKELLPIFHLISPDRKGDMVIAVPWNGDFEKELAVAKVKEFSRNLDAQAVVFTSECWLLVKPVPLTPWHARRQSETWVRPSESPDRKEAVFIIGMNKAGEVEVASLQIVRDRPGGRIISLVRDEGLEDSSNYDSWMFKGMFKGGPK